MSSTQFPMGNRDYAAPEPEQSGDGKAVAMLDVLIDQLKGRGVVSEAEYAQRRQALLQSQR